MPSSTQSTQANKRGQSDYYSGFNSRENPFPHSDPLFDDWEDGWLFAQEAEYHVKCSNAFSEGKRAFLQGDELKNPYDFDSIENPHWYDGWVSAEASLLTEE